MICQRQARTYISAGAVGGNCKRDLGVQDGRAGGKAGGAGCEDRGSHTQRGGFERRLANWTG